MSQPYLEHCHLTVVYVCTTVYGALCCAGCGRGENVLAYLRTLYTELQLTLQPLVVSVDGLAVVAYNDYRLKVESLVKGIDLCFKLIQVLC